MQLKVFLYLKSDENIKDFDLLIKKLCSEEQNKLYVAMENRRCFRELDKIYKKYILSDVIIVHSLNSLGLTDADKVAYLEFLIKHDYMLAILDQPATYEYGIVQPINKAVLSSILQNIKKQNNRLEFPDGRRSNCGRKRIEFPEGWEELYAEWKSGKIDSKEFLTLSGLKKTSFYNLVAEYKAHLNSIEEYKKHYKCS